MEDIEWAQDHLCIMSGMYGLLRPLDTAKRHKLTMDMKASSRPGTWTSEPVDACAPRTISSHAPPPRAGLGPGWREPSPVLGPGHCPGDERDAGGPRPGLAVHRQLPGRARHGGPRYGGPALPRWAWRAAAAACPGRKCRFAVWLRCAATLLSCAALAQSWTWTSRAPLASSSSTRASSRASPLRTRRGPSGRHHLLACLRGRLCDPRVCSVRLRFPPCWPRCGAA